MTTWSTTNKSSTVTLSNANLTATSSTAVSQSAQSSTSKNSGLVYIEFVLGTLTNDLSVGICNSSEALNPAGGLGSDANGAGFYAVSPTQALYVASSLLTAGTVASTAGDVVGMAINFNTTPPTAWISDAAMRSQGATYNNSGTADPATNTGGIPLTGLGGGPYYAVFNDDIGGASVTVNFGASAFNQTVPSGYHAWDAVGSVATITGSATVSPVGASQAAASAAITGSATVTGVGSTRLIATATITGSATVTGVTASTGGSTGTASIAGHATVTGVTAVQIAATAAITGKAFVNVVVGASGPQLLPAGPLSTSGSQIVDQHGNPVRIASIGWSGSNQRGGVPEGLDQVNYQTLLNQVVSIGYNTIRLTFCDASVINNDMPAAGLINTTLNPTMAGLTCLQVHDLIIGYCGSIGLRVIIDSHNNEGANTLNFGANQPNGLWYDLGGGSDGTDQGGNTGTVTDAAFLAMWQSIATRYGSYAAIVGYDLRNEPNTTGQDGPGVGGGCTWGDGSNRDIRAMYQRVGNAIQAIDPRPLIICEGPQNYGQTFATGTTSDGYNYGSGTTYFGNSGDLTLVRTLPVTLSLPNKVYYSVHEYPPETSGNPADAASSAKIANMNAVWGYLVIENIAPVWLGEMGTYLNGNSTQLAQSTAWCAMMVSYLNGTAAGGPAFSGTQQGIGWDWWDLAVDENGDGGVAVPDFGILTAWSGGVARANQYAVYSQLFYLGVPAVAGVGTSGGGTVSIITGSGEAVSVQPGRAPLFAAADFAQAMANLMPRGIIWRRDPGSVLMQTLGALAPTYERNTAAAAALLVDAFPDTTTNLLPEWEASLGLPDPCSAANPSVAQRAAAVAAKFGARGGQSPGFFIALAAALGFVVTITQFWPFCADAACDGPDYDAAWASAWQVNAPQVTSSYFIADLSSADDPLETYDAAELVCRMTQYAPAHTTLIFAFS
jgi:uncharacterized protein YmfQ (DUF2313 family)